MEFNALVITDTHGMLNHDCLKNTLAYSIEAVFLLGDINPDELKELKSFSVENDLFICGIPGNHDSFNELSEAGIINLHSTTVKFKDLVIAGFGGSWKYKNTNSGVLFTNNECSDCMAVLPKCDILLTHDRPNYDKEETNMVHQGLIGITEYIEKNKPKYLLHGHCHESETIQYDNTIVYSCYGISIVHLIFNEVI